MAGSLPREPESSDPCGEVVQAYATSEGSGGFLFVCSTLAKNNEPPHLYFSFYNERGEVFRDTPSL